MPESGFSKEWRLLTPKHYSAVFNAVAYKVPHRNLLILAAPSSTGHARLGLIFAKRNLKQAHERNRVKRLVRESFRARKADLPAVDLIVMGRQGLADIDNASLSVILEKLWQRLSKAAQNAERKSSERKSSEGKSSEGKSSDARTSDKTLTGGQSKNLLAS